jgi:hypothetical protein
MHVRTLQIMAILMLGTRLIAGIIKHKRENIAASAIAKLNNAKFYGTTHMATPVKFIDEYDKPKLVLIPSKGKLQKLNFLLNRYVAHICC